MILCMEKLESFLFKLMMCSLYKILVKTDAHGGTQTAFESV